MSGFHKSGALQRKLRPVAEDVKIVAVAESIHLRGLPGISQRGLIIEAYGECDVFFAWSDSNVEHKGVTRTNALKLPATPGQTAGERDLPEAVRDLPAPI